MLRILRQIARTGTVTEAPLAAEEEAVERLGIAVRRRLEARFGGSLTIRQVDAGSCNACELEIHALEAPQYDLARYGIHFVASPRHADALLVTGPVSRHMEAALRRTWRATPAPKLVIAAGDCAVCGGEFVESYACCGPVSRVIPVDVTIPGCPPSPQALLVGLLAALERR